MIRAITLRPCGPFQISRILILSLVCWLASVRGMARTVARLITALSPGDFLQVRPLPVRGGLQLPKQSRLPGDGRETVKRIAGRLFSAD